MKAKDNPLRDSRRGLLFCIAFILAVTVLSPVVTAAALDPANEAITPKGHEKSEGWRLIAAQGDINGSPVFCSSKSFVREFSIVSIPVDITLNRFGDHDPQGFMYVLEDRVARVRREEVSNASARHGHHPFAVSLGLQGDAIQPLTLRAHAGDCVRITLRNELKEPASLHIHGASLRVLPDGSAAVATNELALAKPGVVVRYEWAIPADEPEGTHYFHSHGNTRAQTSHGLFGALIVEPKDSTWIDPRNGGLAYGWDAIVSAPRARAFREYALYYHEIGDESYQLLDGHDHPVPQVDTILGDYRPGARALNYRSEPFMNRMKLGQSVTGRADESLAYSSYAFGDPATPIARAYVGDPVKMRLIHAGSEVAHVHHVHGGSIRWARHPELDPHLYTLGFTKKPPLTPGPSERTDSQSIGPSETFDTENECGAGGCQGSSGDFLYHCHVAQHYFAGMWGIWRVYNTLQAPGAQTDSLPPLAALNDREHAIPKAVSSSALIGKTVTFRGKPHVFSSTFASLVLPPAGAPSGYDASVFNWSVLGNRVVGAPEDRHIWPGYASSQPGKRPAILFDPRTGLPAYPFMRPHLGARPPFAPGHGPAPYLDPGQPSNGPLAPGADGPMSLCPRGTHVVSFRINAITLPIPLNPSENLVDPDGMLYVLAEQEAAVRAHQQLATPLVIRANAQQDCVDVVFATSIPDSPVTRDFAKANLHIHFVQFDVQASDGVVTGFNYEQSVRPYTTSGSALLSISGATIAVSSTSGFHVGSIVGIGLDTPRSFESAKIMRIAGASLFLDHPLHIAHRAGERVSNEFVRYRWYPDAQTGTAYFHDHVNALESWRHGLFGALIVEPPGSTYHDPHTGAVVRNGALADIYTSSPVAADIKGSFREAVLMLIDDVPITAGKGSLGGAINMRAEPLDRRGPDPPFLLSSSRGPPQTPLIEANLGDPVVFRTMVGATNDVHTFHVQGHWFRTELFDPSAPPVQAVHVGISERFDLAVASAGGPQRMPGDYLYEDGRSSKLRDGAWGVFRVYRAGSSVLKPLPGTANASALTETCPAHVPTKSFDVSAVSAPATSTLASNARVFVATADRTKATTLATKLEPLVLRVNEGDCITVHLTNFTDKPVSLAPDLVSFDPASSGGIAVGMNNPQGAPPDSRYTYTWYADPSMGPRVGLLRDMDDPINGTRSGLFGALVIAPIGTTFFDAHGVKTNTGTFADAQPKSGAPWRDDVIFMSDDDGRIGTHQMPYTQSVNGFAALSYRANPLERSSNNWNTSKLETPVINAYAGDPLQLHVLSVASEQLQVFSLEEQQWKGLQAGDAISSTLIGGLESITIEPMHGAGGGFAARYLYGNHREPFREAGMWGIMNVRPSCSTNPALRRLPGLASESACGESSHVLLILLGVGVLALGFVGIRRSRKSKTH